MPVTETEPKLQKLPKRFKTGAEISDYSITVIENPIVDDHIGYLFARRFIDTAYIKKFGDVSYFRIKMATFEVKNNISYPTVEISPGFHPRKKMLCDFLIAKGNSIGVLEKPSSTPYQICFFEPEQFDQYLDKLKGLKDVEKTLEKINTTLVEKIDSFRFLGSSKILVLPENYASLEIV